MAGRETLTRVYRGYSSKGKDCFAPSRSDFGEPEGMAGTVRQDHRQSVASWQTLLLRRAGEHRSSHGKPRCCRSDVEAQRLAALVYQLSHGPSERCGEGFA